MAPANWGWNEYYEEYTCYDCNYSYQDRDDLDDHLDYHHFACLCPSEASRVAQRRQS